MSPRLLQVKTPASAAPRHAAASRRRRGSVGILLACVTLLAGCAGGRTPPLSERAAAVQPPREALPFDEAVLRLAVATLDGAELPAPPPGGRHKLVIDPLIDRATGAETAATRRMVARIETLVAERYPQFALQPFDAPTLDEKPLILLGAMTGVTAPGSLANATAPTGTYRIWAVLADLRSERILSHPTAWARADTADTTPAPFFQASPAWVGDEAQAAYLRTCAGNPGAPIDPTYLRNLRAQALTAAAVRAQETNRPAQALTLLQQARAAPGGEQQRVLNGIYLANRSLGRPAAAEAAFADIVDFGLTRDRLAVKLLFRPGSDAFVTETALSGPYPMWLRQIAAGADRRGACLRVAGHASVTGPAAVNDRVSLARAERVRRSLIAQRRPLAERVGAVGEGSRQPIVGSGTDDARDALDRRVEFNPLPCPVLTAARG